MTVYYIIQAIKNFHLCYQKINTPLNNCFLSFSFDTYCDTFDYPCNHKAHYLNTSDYFKNDMTYSNREKIA